MASPNQTRFDDLLLDAIAAIQTIASRRDGWDAASPEEKGRAVELSRGLAGERRYAHQAGDEALVAKVDALKASAEAQLRMIDGRTAPGDEDLASRLEGDRAAYAAAATAPRA